jgi:hypothetical protein
MAIDKYEQFLAHGELAVGDENTFSKAGKSSASEHEAALRLLHPFYHESYKDADGIVPLIEKHKRPYMLWNPFMTEFHILLLSKLSHKIQEAAVA